LTWLYAADAVELCSRWARSDTGEVIKRPATRPIEVWGVRITGRGAEGDRGEIWHQKPDEPLHLKERADVASRWLGLPVRVADTSAKLFSQRRGQSSLDKYEMKGQSWYFS
jgi:hypothetical protein